MRSCEDSKLGLGQARMGHSRPLLRFQLKTREITSQIGSARLSFGSSEEMEEMLDCAPGSSSILGLMNDKEHRVRLLVD